MDREYDISADEQRKVELDEDLGPDVPPTLDPDESVEATEPDDTVPPIDEERRD